MHLNSGPDRSTARCPWLSTGSGLWKRPADKQLATLVPVATDDDKLNNSPAAKREIFIYKKTRLRNGVDGEETKQKESCGSLIEITMRVKSDYV